ncbi:MAG: insulinase family protein [Bacteroidales bacterium]|nr:insulinase family protein [Bacteroidales bacterium]
MRKIVLLLALLSSILVSSQGLKTFKLSNGLSVFVWEDSSQTEVFGMVSVRAGSVNDPEEYTGLAHYLEHLMFKGTERLGALEWEKEKIYYDSIIQKYDERASVNDPVKQREIDLAINKLTVEQAKMSQQNEFNTLIESIGGTGLNAGTSMDYTVYYNRFPKVQLEKWLELYSVRFMNPVFRSFQTELETVYEEYNMYQDNRNVQVRNFVLDKAFQGHPYGRPIIGKGEHLKNPQISKLQEFYNTWYVPENMALILVGDIKTEEIAALVNKKFSRLTGVPNVERDKGDIPKFNGRNQITENIGQIPQVALIYNGISSGHADEIALEVAIEMLSNRNRTGLLDKLSLNGDLMSAYAGTNFLNDGGRIIINAIPTYDYGQRRFESHKNVERMVSDQIRNLANGNVEEWLLETVKNNLIRSYLRSLESSSGKASILSTAFVNRYDIDWVLNYNELVHSVSIDDVKRVVKKYLSEDFLALYLNEGKNEKNNKIEKPDLPLIPDFPKTMKSIYAEWFSQIPVGDVDFPEKSFDEILIKAVNEKSKLFYKSNDQNDIFTLTLKYGIGERDIPQLSMSIDLMNSAGIMALYEPQEFRNALTRLNASVSYSSNDDYTIVNIEGTEEELAAICNLVTRQILMPKLEVKQLNAVKGRFYQSYRIEKEEIDSQEEALLEYVLYKNKSSYIDRLGDEDIVKLTVSDLVGAFQKATDYAAEIHYVGSLPFETVHSILSANLPLKAKELDSESPKVKPLETYSENIVYFLPNYDVNQSRIHFYVLGDEFSPTLSSRIYAFNQYFSGGFGGLVMNEIREKNSMAYTTFGQFRIPPIQDEKFYFHGFIGTQTDKTINAIDLFMNLVNDMPVNHERMDDLRNYIRQALLSEQAEFRTVSQYYERLKRMGYSDLPFKVIVPEIEVMDFDDIIGFYETYLKNKPIVISIVGNPKIIDLKLLEKYGKVERLSVSKLFK